VPVGQTALFFAGPRSRDDSGGIGEIRFQPARWILVLAAIAARLLLKGGTLGRFGVVGLVWAFAPRKLKFAAAGLAAAAAIVLVGAVAAITLLTLQLVNRTSLAGSRLDRGRDLLDTGREA
jgi:hypothetical protein